MKRLKQVRGSFRACVPVAAVAVLLGTCALASAQGVISDTEFNNADWNEVVSFNANPTDWPTIAVQQYTTGGNPGAFRGQTWDYVNNDGASVTIGTTDVLTAQNYDPATQGAVTSISFSIDDYIADVMGGTVAKVIGFAPVISQDGNLYDAYGSIISSSAAWTTNTWSGLVPANFYHYAGGGPATPDFSAAGAPMTFGYYDYLSVGPGLSPYGLFHGVDNFTVTLVPEPASALLLLAAPLLMRRRRWI